LSKAVERQIQKAIVIVSEGGKDLVMRMRRGEGPKVPKGRTREKI
jgi:hypothetical protein